MPTDLEVGPGRRVGNVVVERELGAGAYGVVYQGRDTLLDRPVALKVLKPRGLFASAAERTRFLAEAKVVASLVNPHVVTLFHVHTMGDEGCVLELEFVEGGTLADLLGDGLRLPPETVVRIGRELAAGLAAAHARGIVHGDVKPENVLLARDGTAKLSDFGLARVVGERELERSSGAARIGGTPYYMAPEVILGEGNVAASDVWSLGVLLYRMLTGHLPFGGATLNALFYAIQNEVPEPPGTTVPTGLVALLDRCLAKRVEDRPATGADVRALLDQALEAGPERAPAPAPAPGAAGGAGVARAAPLVGREEESARLEATLERVAAGKGATVLVTGDAGIGKSALLEAAAARAGALGFRWIQTSVSPSEGFLRPLLDSVRWALSREPGSDPLARLDSEAFGPAAALLRRLLTSAGAPELETRQQTTWALQHLFQGLAAERPLALVIEGAQNAEAAELVVLRDLARRTSDARILIVVACRTGEAGQGFGTTGSVSALAEVEGIIRIELRPLPSEALYALLETAAGAEVSAAVAERVVSRAEGNPLFALELLRHLETTEAVARVRGVLRPGDAWEAEGVPARLVDLCSGRLRRLPPAARSLLDVAAVDGLEFDGEALAAVLKKDLLSILRQLQRLARDENVVVPRSRGYRFTHALLREVLYAEVAPDLRRELHRRLAEHLETRKDAVAPERLALHWEGADDLPRAVPFLREAAWRSALRSENARALDLGRRAGLVAGRIDVRTAKECWELLLRLARAAANVEGRDEDVEAIFEILLRAADEDRDSLRRLRAVVRRAHFRFFRRGWQPGDEEDVRRAASLLPISVDLGWARYLLGVTAKFRGDLDEASSWLLRAEEVCDAVPDAESQRTSVVDQLASVAMRGGRLQEAETRYAEAARLGEREGKRVHECVSEVNHVLASFARGCVDGHEETLDRAIRRLRLERAPRLAAHAMTVEAQILLARGDLSAAAETVERAAALLPPSAYLPSVTAVETERGYLAAVRGHLDAAEAAFETGLSAAEKQGDVAAQVMLFAHRAQNECFRGDGPRATACARRVLALLRDSTQALAGVQALLALFEAGLYGLDPGVLREAAAALPALRPAPFALFDVAEATAPAVVSLAAGRADPRELATAATALSGEGVGQRRAVLRILASWLSALAADLEGRRDVAVETADSARKAARRLGHVWLEAGLIRLLLGWGAGAEWATRRSEILRSAAERLPDLASRERLLAAWGA